jgi:hypothetical protein
MSVNPGGVHFEIPVSLMFSNTLFKGREMGGTITNK